MGCGICGPARVTRARVTRARVTRARVTRARVTRATCQKSWRSPGLGGSTPLVSHCSGGGEEPGAGSASCRSGGARGQGRHAEADPARSGQDPRAAGNWELWAGSGKEASAAGCLCQCHDIFCSSLLLLPCWLMRWVRHKRSPPDLFIRQWPHSLIAKHRRAFSLALLGCAFIALLQTGTQERVQSYKQGA